jgi:hypothetical protein
MPVVAVLQHAGSTLGSIDEKQERQAEQAKSVSGLLDGKAWGRLRADGQRQLKWGQLIRRRRHH